MVLDLAEIRKPRQFSCHQAASLRVADLELHRQRPRAAGHDSEGHCQPSGRTRAQCRGLARARAQLRQSVKDLNERLERALAADLDRIKTSDELLRTASQVRQLRSRDTRLLGIGRNAGIWQHDTNCRLGIRHNGYNSRRVADVSALADRCPVRQG